jgi:RHS repeat-associated protein
LRRTLSRTYNVRGQLSAIVDGLNQTVFSAATADSYDPNGNLLRSTDALGTQRQLGYDALSRLVSIVDNANGTDSATANTQGVFNRDALDRIDGISDPDGLNTMLDYDGLGNVLAQRSPDSGTTQNVYDAAGNLTQSIDAKGVVRTYTYDYFNRVTSLSTGSPSDAVTYSYDQANSITGCSASYPIGRLTRVAEGAVITTYCYDAQGRVTEKQQIQGTHTDTTRYGYTKAGRLSTITQASGTQVSYTRNHAGQVTTLSVTPAQGAAVTVAGNITYLPFGPIASYTLGNGQIITRTYDANYRLTDLTSTALKLHYVRDANGNVTGIGLDRYSYDPLGRLIAVKDANGAVLESYTYTKTGDRLSKTGSGLATGNYGYQAGTHWLTTVGSAARSHDANGNTTGNTTAGETWGYGYDGHNRMTVLQREGATVASYTYNAFGERIAKAVTLPNVVNERFVYNEASQLISELGTTNKDYIWLDDLPLAVVDRTDTVSTVNYVTADGLNTPRVVTNASGTVIWSWSPIGNAFGEQQPTSTTGYVYNVRFPGQYFDAESGLNYNVHRYLDTAIGRYTQNDPIGFGGGQWSLYSYVSGNPLFSTDPLGLREYPAVILEGGFGIGVAGVAGGSIYVIDPKNAGKVHSFGYAGPNVGPGIPLSSYGSMQIAVVDASSINDISGFGWSAGGALASPSGGVAGGYSAPFWFQDASYSIKSVGVAAGGSANAGVGVSYTWSTGIFDISAVPGAIRDGLKKAGNGIGDCE